MRWLHIAVQPRLTDLRKLVRTSCKRRRCSRSRAPRGWRRFRLRGSRASRHVHEGKFGEISTRLPRIFGPAAVLVSVGLVEGIHGQDGVRVANGHGSSQVCGTTRQTPNCYHLRHSTNPTLYDREFSFILSQHVLFPSQFYQAYFGPATNYAVVLHGRSIGPDAGPDSKYPVERVYPH